MDRNTGKYLTGAEFHDVALRKESVDRNAEKMKVGGIDVSSLSARRAWIEISIIVSSLELKESLSARRAWIEI